jgi:hypothetical protein
MAVAVVVLLGGGGAAYWMYAKGGEPKDGVKKAKEEERPRGLARPSRWNRSS